ncbi:uncharacterized protein At1g66480-like [Diospyros lotus]|uniref:uncharacterized protein At1g66480-like n=1 Tax=Diospyros lotus TaxID=55363 RepID=UPI002255BC4B|nr:uncharacterized protein At1g66480-like [Diospyros lotus]
MGNTLGARKTAKIMKINGETMRLKTPVKAGDVVKDYPGYVVLESEAVKHFGVRAKPLDPWQELKPKRLYFLVELPKVSDEKAPRRVRSGIQMSAKDRLESLMLARRSVSDLSAMKPASNAVREPRGQSTVEDGKMRLKMRLPRSEVARLMAESKDEADAAKRILELCMANEAAAAGEEAPLSGQQQPHWKGGHERVVVKDFKAREKRVGFLPISEGEIKLAVA